MPADAVFSGRTAAWLHGLDVEPCDPIEVGLPKLSTTSHLAGTSLVRSDFTDSEICEVRGLPATTPLRTLADIARHERAVESVVILDMAVRARIVTLDELLAWPETHARHRGLGRLKRSISLADGRSESPMETRLRVLLVAGGLPSPCVQADVYDSSGGFLARADLLYPDARLVIEYDGASHRSSLAADNRRQNRLIGAGYRVLRFTGADVLHTPASVVGQVQRALGPSGPSGHLPASGEEFLLFDRFAELTASGWR